MAKALSQQSLLFLQIFVIIIVFTTNLSDYCTNILVTLIGGCNFKNISHLTYHWPFIKSLHKPSVILDLYDWLYDLYRRCITMLPYPIIEGNIDEPTFGLYPVQYCMIRLTDKPKHWIIFRSNCRESIWPLLEKHARLQVRPVKQ